MNGDQVGAAARTFDDHIVDADVVSVVSSAAQKGVADPVIGVRPNANGSDVRSTAGRC